MRYTFLLLLGLFLVSCSEDKQSASLNESEIFFEETLASISKDNIEENLFYIGTEDGIVYIYNSENQQLRKVKTSFDRIYKVVRDSIGNYWVGTRNMGLFCCENRDDSLCVKEKHGRFYLPLKSKRSRYSAYDISIQQSKVYVATSHGLCYVPNEADGNDSTLKILYPSRQTDAPENTRPVGTRSLQPYKNLYLFCASDSGLVRVGLADGSLRKLSARKTHNIDIHDDLVYSLIGDSLIATDINGKTSESFALKHPAQIYYYDKTEQTNYFISNHHIQMVKDKDLHDMGKFEITNSSRSIRPKCRNLIENDLQNRQSLLVTTHSILRIGHHQDVFNTIGNVKLACTDKDYAYFLVDTKLYRLKKGNDEAEQIKDIDRGNKDVIFMEVLNDTIYYVDADHHIYKAKLYSNYLWNSLFSWDSKISLGKKAKLEVTAIGKDAENIYVGVRDGLRNINRIHKDIPLHIPSTKATISDPFITRFATAGDNLILCTLNDGVFVGQKDSFTRVSVGSEPYSFIRDVAGDSLGNIKHILTNRGYFVKNDGTAFTQKVGLSGYNRLLALDAAHVYGIPSFGITNLCDSMSRYFIDIQFNPMACLVFDGKVYAGSSNGVYVFSAKLSKENHIEAAGSYHQIKFNGQEYFSRTNILTFIIILFVGILSLWWYDRYRMSRHAVRTFKDGLILRLNELNAVREHLDATTIGEIAKLNSEVESVDVAEKKKALNQLRSISLRIMELTSRVPAMLIQLLHEQVGQMKKAGLNDAADYVDNTNKAIKKHTLQSLNKQIRENAEWLSRTQSALNKLAFYKSLYSTLPLIPGVTYEIVKTLNSAKSINEQIDIIEKQSSNINTPSSRNKIKEYIDTKIKESCTAQLDFDEQSRFYTTLGLIQTKYADIKDCMDATDNLVEVINRIPAVNRHLAILLLLREISNHLPEYDIAKDEYKKKNDEVEERKKKGFYSLKGKSVREADENERIKRLEHLKSISTAILKNIDDFYQQISRGSEMNLLKELGINFKKDNKGYTPANLLALLITGSKIPVSRFHILLETTDQSVRRVKRELKKQIKLHKDTITQYAQKNDTSIAILLLDLEDTEDE